jgi:hypothetical protein
MPLWALGLFKRFPFIPIFRDSESQTSEMFWKFTHPLPTAAFLAAEFRARIKSI